jgi:hypothetical protein
MYKPLALGVVLAIVGTAVAGGSWTQTPVWNFGSTVYRLRIGDARADGHQRLYCGNRDGSVNELSRETGVWVRRQIGSVPDIAYDIAIAQGRNDRTARVYVACGDGHMYEFSYSAGSWSRTDMGGVGGVDLDEVAFGKGRNDGFLRGYATGNNGHIYEFSWTGSTWTCLDLGRVAAQMVDIAVGRTGHGRKNHVYASSQAGGIYELTWDNGWTSAMIDQLAGHDAAWGIDVGRASGTSDDVTDGWAEPSDPDRCEDLDLYVTAWSEPNVWRFHWENGVWRKLSIGTVPNYPYGADLTLGPGRGDGRVRVYESNNDGHVYEFSCAGGRWSSMDMGASGSTNLTGVIVGAARDDGIQRVYLGCPNGRIIEFTWNGVDDALEAAGQSSNAASGTALTARPSLFRRQVEFSLAGKRNRGAEILVSDFMGRTVRRLAVSQGVESVVWDGRDGSGAYLPPGVYFAQLSDRLSSPALRLVKAGDYRARRTGLLRPLHSPAGPDAEAH